MMVLEKVVWPGGWNKRVLSWESFQDIRQTASVEIINELNGDDLGDVGER